MEITTVRTEGLGDSTYVLVHDGLALVVDPQRDIDRFEQVLDDAGADLRLVVETHLHNDYVSGGLDLARATGADLFLPAGAAPAFRHKPAFHNEDIPLGSIAIRPLHTPGHTPEHTSYAVVIDGTVVAVFSGGSLLVGSAGRSDLLGEERADTLSRLQYGSITRLAALPDEAGLYPTHGAGSFCAVAMPGTPTSTIGTEKKTNPVLSYADEDAFVKGQLASLVPYPNYYSHMGALNLTGLPEPDLDVPLLESIPEGVTVVDARPRERFAAGHLPGALGIELLDSFGTWVGWLTEHNTPLVLILDEDQDPDEAIRQLIRIGYDDIRGIARNPETGLSSYRTVDADEYREAIDAGAQLLDVRAPNEWNEGFVEGSTLSYLPHLVEKTPEGLDPGQPVWVVCGSGYRASIAAGVLQDRGFEPVVLADGGATDLVDRASE